jgi:glucokinase-like ROK family protein
MKTRYRTGDQNWVRERNLAIMLNYIWEAGQPIARPRLTEISGLNKSTVGALLTQLETWGFIRETGHSASHPGRPGALIDLNPDAGRMIGIEIGVVYMAIALTDMKAQIVWERRVETAFDSSQPQDQNEATVLEQAEQLLDEAYAVARVGGYRVFGIGVAFPGLIDHARGTVLFAPNLGWRNVPLRERWWKRFGVPVIVENDANAAAIGEQMLGVARLEDNFIYLSASIGLGAGIVIDRKIYGGVGGFAGEVGHTTVKPDGPLCKCGNRGCWETLITPKAILQRVREEVLAGQSPTLLPMFDEHAPHYRLNDFLPAADRGEQAVLRALEETGSYLGIGVANLINIFNPSMVVLGGVFNLVGPYLLEFVQREVDNRTLSDTREVVTVTLSAFRFYDGVIGGVSLILREILNNPTAWQPKPTVDSSLNGSQMVATSVL